jgi:hypothetical protein
VWTSFIGWVQWGQNDVPGSIMGSTLTILTLPFLELCSIGGRFVPISVRSPP